MNERELPAPPTSKPLKGLDTLDLGEDLALQGLVCDVDDPDCVVPASVPSPASGEPSEGSASDGADSI